MDKKNKKRFKLIHFILFFVVGIIFVFLVYYTTMLLLATTKTINSINTKYSYTQIEKTSIDERFFKDSAFAALQKEKAFYQSKLIMAETDSIGLTIDLPDSLASLEINGVIVHKTKISSMSESVVFSKANSYSIASMLSKPLLIVNRYSTIKREPLMIKMAPKDTSEYKPDIIPDTTNAEPVNYILEMDNGIRLFFYQEECKKMSDLYNQTIFDFKDRLRTTTAALDSVKKFSIPQYHPFIKIRLPKVDAKIIYRALPEKGLVVVFR